VAVSENPDPRTGDRYSGLRPSLVTPPPAETTSGGAIMLGGKPESVCWL
jgi:hypothetical protein